MSTVVQESEGVVVAGSEGRCTLEDDLRAHVLGLLARGFRTRSSQVERRNEQRYPFPYLLRLTPAHADGTPAEGESVVVVGKHVSERGLGFYHTQSLPYRHMIVSFENSSGLRLSFLIDLSWCRFTRQGWYESGGRFLQAVSTPAESR